MLGPVENWQPSYGTNAGISEWNRSDHFGSYCLSYAHLQFRQRRSRQPWLIHAQRRSAPTTNAMARFESRIWPLYSGLMALFFCERWASREEQGHGTLDFGPRRQMARLEQPDDALKALNQRFGREYKCTRGKIGHALRPFLPAPDAQHILEREAIAILIVQNSPNSWPSSTSWMQRSSFN